MSKKHRLGRSERLQKRPRLQEQAGNEPESAPAAGHRATIDDAATGREGVPARPDNLPDWVQYSASIATQGTCYTRLIAGHTITAPAEPDTDWHPLAAPSHDISIAATAFFWQG